MTENERKTMLQLADTIEGEINRMCVTKELTEFDTMYGHAKRNLDKLSKMIYDARFNAEVRKHDRAIKALEREPRWIPVSEDLPKENKTVIASTKYDVYPEAKYTKKYGWEWAYEAGADYWKKLENVEAWMHLPGPYKAESEE